MKKLFILRNYFDAERNHFVFEKNDDFVKVFPELLSSLGLPVTEILKEKEGLFDVMDVVERTKNSDFDTEIFYGKEKIHVIIRTLMKEIFNEKMNKFAERKN